MATPLVKEFLEPGAEVVETDPFELLTNRELEVLPLVAKGYGNKEIAEMLHISVKTVEAHKARLMDKLNLKKTSHNLWNMH